VKVAEVFEKYRTEFGSVPAVGQDFVCHYCVGPLDPQFSQCFGCYRLFDHYHPVGNTEWLRVPDEIRDRVAPMTAALMPSPWYAYLYQYKRGYLDAYGPIIAALTHTYLGLHDGDVAQLLGGEPTHVTVVPSTRGFAFADQALVKALSLAPSLAGRVVPTLDHVPGTVVQRHRYNPAAFRPASVNVTGARVLILEDAWVTGGKAMSAAGALLRDGAASVAVLAVARVVDAGYWSDANHPYRKAMQTPYNPTAWPR
jgi:hypothetical protein